MSLKIKLHQIVFTYGLYHVALENIQKNLAIFLILASKIRNEPLLCFINSDF